MLNKISVFIKFILKKSFFLKISSESNVLLYNKSSSPLKKIINKKNLSKVYIDRNEINLFVALLTLITGKISYLNYANIFIKFAKPKVIITFIDNDINFYKLKQLHPNKCFIVVQNGYRFKSREPFFAELIKAKKKDIPLEVDYFFTHNKYYMEYLKKYIKSNSIINGSFRNNLVKIKKNQKSNKNILFLSQFYPRTNNVSNDEYLTFYSLEKKLLPILETYCFKNKLNLDIMFRYNKKAISKYNLEMNFYNSFIKNFRGLRDHNIYNMIDNYENIITIDSTLGYEALTRNKKVFFFHNRVIKKNNIYYKDQFGWPKFFKKNNFFCDINEKKINKYLRSNLNLSYQKWFKINNKHFNNFIVFDYKNKKLSKLIQSILNK